MASLEVDVKNGIWRKAPFSIVQNKYGCNRLSVSNSMDPMHIILSAHASSSITSSYLEHTKL